MTMSLHFGSKVDKKLTFKSYFTIFSVLSEISFADVSEPLLF
jgi:hypothetical protein